MLPRIDRILVWVVVLAFIVAAAIFVHVSAVWFDTRGQDIYYEWWQGRFLAEGKNPYVQVLDADMLGRNPERVATYFPLLYVLYALTQLAGLKDYDRWVSFWRFIFMLFDVGLAALLFEVFRRRRRVLVGLLAAAFWFFNRWTLHVAVIGHVDFLPIFFLVLSLVWFGKRPWLSMVLFGVSLALKQIAIFLGPLYVIWMWRRARERRFRCALYGALAVAAVPLAVSLPFILWHAEAFFKSLAFSATRRSDALLEAASIDAALGLKGLSGRLPLLVLMALVYVGALRGHLRRYVSALLAMVVFTGFNPVLFPQYLCWVVPLAPLCALDYLEGQRRTATPARAP